MWHEKSQEREEKKLSLNARSFVFDAGVVSLYYAGVQDVKPYFDRVFSGRTRGFVSEVNLAEFYYKTSEKKGVATAEVWYLQLRRSRLRVVPPNESITRQAALWKVKNRELSLADCFALATSEAKSGPLLTTDSTIKQASEKGAVFFEVL